MTTSEWRDGFNFEILAEDPDSNARVGLLTTPHGVIQTPAFMPVGTYGAVKGIAPDELKAAGAEIILSNALHLEFRPGAETIFRLGGLHRVMSWEGPILTDSGGFQTYSLRGSIRQQGDGIIIKSPVNGAHHSITPEKVIEIQRNLGTDFMMPLDLCPPGRTDRRAALTALQRTLLWAKTSRLHYDRTNPLHGKPQALFGILQGGIYEDLRRTAMEELLEIGFFGYAVGGLAVGEDDADRWRIVEFCCAALPREQPRYLMGVGTPEDLETAISRGIDLFDCVLPTRNGRKGSLFTAEGKINLRNAAFREDATAVQEDCRCAACKPHEDDTPRFSRGAIRHLLTVGDPLGMRLGALHNLTYYFRLLQEIRTGILKRSGRRRTNKAETATTKTYMDPKDPL
jgi:queuine tRNA-ribosyltransferase